MTRFYSYLVYWYIHVHHRKKSDVKASLKPGEFQESEIFGMNFQLVGKNMCK